jgi:hypothetical protein
VPTPSAMRGDAITALPNQCLGCGIEKWRTSGCVSGDLPLGRLKLEP